MANALASAGRAGPVRIGADQYFRFLRQAFADFYADGRFEDFIDGTAPAFTAELKAEVEKSVQKATQEFTHSFPAWTLGMERTSPFEVGPVTFFSRTDWVAVVDFPKTLKDHYLNVPEANHRWKELVIEALNKPRGQLPVEGLGEEIYDALSKCPAVARVSIRDHEKQLSRQLARIAAKTALDSLSLCLGSSQFFHQQSLQDERQAPLSRHTLIESNGFLSLLGYALGPQIPSVQPADVRRLLDKARPSIAACGEIVRALTDPGSHKNPQLASRWATALDWFAEGNREPSDLIAVAKLGCSLDILACGGESRGILEMVVNLTGTAADDIVIKGDEPQTLRELVTAIYNEGRSQILHGNHHDRLKSHAAVRGHAAYIGRILLLETALGLQRLTTVEKGRAFREMKREPMSPVKTDAPDDKGQSVEAKGHPAQ